MNVTIAPDLQPFVDQLVATGNFSSAEAVVSEAVRRLQEDQVRFEELKASIAEAIAEVEQTGGTPLDFDEIRRKAREYAATLGRT